MAGGDRLKLLILQNRSRSLFHLIRRPQEISVLFPTIKPASRWGAEINRRGGPPHQSDLIDAVIHHTGRLTSGWGRDAYVDKMHFQAILELN
jgi:hypothetical protein